MGGGGYAFAALDNPVPITYTMAPRVPHPQALRCGWATASTVVEKRRKLLLDTPLPPTESAIRGARGSHRGKRCSVLAEGSFRARGR